MPQMTAYIRDLFSVSADDRVCLVLDNLPYIPQVGDELHFKGQTKVIEAVDRVRAATCVTAQPSSGLGALGVLVECDQRNLKQLLAYKRPFEVEISPKAAGHDHVSR